MNTSPIEHFLRRDKCVRPVATGREVLGVAVGLVVIVLGFIAIVPMTARAQETTPKHLYPLTNRGSCERLHYEGMGVQGASMREIISLCAKEGVRL